MAQIAFVIFLAALCFFMIIMLHDPRTLWSGISFFWMAVCLLLFLFFLLSQYSDWLASHDILIGALVVLFILAAFSIAAFPAALILFFFIEGIRVIRREGLKLSNLLSMLFSICLFVCLAVWPLMGTLEKNTFGRKLYAAVSFLAIYGLSLMAVYSLSAVLNLIHLRKKRKADYIVVLGSGIMGRKVTPLLAARIEKGMELLRHNPDAALLLSGGQGDGEDIPESEAMAAYAAEHGVDESRIIVERQSASTQENLLFSRELMDGQKPWIILVTTAYHVFRALLLARQQGIQCVGFGAKTKWYFALNALIREFIGYLRLTWKRHAVLVGIAAGMVVWMS